MNLDDSEIRASWEVGSDVQVYSSRDKQWVPGKISKVYEDEEGEWLVVDYEIDGNTRQREVPREDHEAICPTEIAPGSQENLAAPSKRARASIFVDPQIIAAAAMETLDAQQRMQAVVEEKDENEYDDDDADVEDAGEADAEVYDEPEVKYRRSVELQEIVVDTKQQKKDRKKAKKRRSAQLNSVPLKGPTVPSIMIELPSGAQIRVPITKKSTVFHLKDLIREKTEIDPETFHIVYEGEEMTPDTQLPDKVFKDGEVLYVELNLVDLVAQQFEIADKNHDGSIDRDEFEVVFRKWMPDATREEMDALFKSFLPKRADDEKDDEKDANEREIVIDELLTSNAFQNFAADMQYKMDRERRKQKKKKKVGFNTGEEGEEGRPSKEWEDFVSEIQEERVNQRRGSIVNRKGRPTTSQPAETTSLEMRIGTIWGTPIFLHWSLPLFDLGLVALYVTLDNTVYGLMFGLITSFAMIFFCAVHEISHYWALRQFSKKKLTKLVIWPFGGLTQWRFKDPGNLYVRILVALGGPMSHVFWIVIFFFIHAAAYGDAVFGFRYPLEFDFVRNLNMWGWTANVLLLVINLVLPLYPLDANTILINLMLHEGFSVPMIADTILGISMIGMMVMAVWGIFVAALEGVFNIVPATLFVMLGAHTAYLWWNKHTHKLFFIGMFEPAGKFVV